MSQYLTHEDARFILTLWIGTLALMLGLAVVSYVFNPARGDKP